MTVALVATLDTKGEETRFARSIIKSQGVDVHVIDTGVMGDPEFEPDTPASTVAERAGTTLSGLRDDADRGGAMDAMGEGAAGVAIDLHDSGGLDGILGLGGSGNTSIATEAMRGLPYGVPKLMVSTMASGDVRPYVGSRDILMMYSVVDIEGLNRLTRRVISNAALAMVGMTSNEPDLIDEGQPTIGVTMFGVTTPCVQTAREALEERGYEVMVFHATGTGGQAMEALIDQGVIDGVLDVTTTELADELVGGVLSAGPNRLEAAGRCAIPQVVSTGALDMVNFGPRDEVPTEFRDRHLHVHNPEVTLMRTTPKENAEIGRLLAEKVNAASGPSVVALPLSGVSSIDVEGEDFYDPEANEALFEAIRSHLHEDVDLLELAEEINNESFALRIAKRLDGLMRASDHSP